MSTACSFFLESGRPCGAPALRDSNWCRHHAPAEPRTLSQNGKPGAEPDSEPQLTRAALSAYWRSTFYHGILEADSEQALHDNMECLFLALVNKDICHRSAGRLFAAIARRRVELGIGEFS